MCVCAAHLGSARLGRFCRGGKLLPPWNLIIFIIIVIIILLLATFYVYYYFIPIKSCGRSASAPSTVIIFVYFIVVLDPDTNPWTHRRGSWRAEQLENWGADELPRILRVSRTVGCGGKSLLLLFLLLLLLATFGLLLWPRSAFCYSPYLFMFVAFIVAARIKFDDSWEKLGLK